MAKPQRKTFEQILRDEAPRNARRLETVARQASWIAKIEPSQSRALYSVKHAALRQLFRIPAQAPLIRDAWCTNEGFLLSVRLRRTRSSLHIPFNELNVITQQAQATYIAERAQGRWWHPRKTARFTMHRRAVMGSAGMAQ